MMIGRVAVVVAGVLAAGGLVGCGDDAGPGSPVEAGAPMSGVECMGSVSGHFAGLDRRPGSDWFRLSDPMIDYTAANRNDDRVPIKEFERLTFRGEDRTTVRVAQSELERWREALGRGSTVLFLGSSSEHFDTFVSRTPLELAEDGSVRVLEPCGEVVGPVLEELAGRHGTDVESLLLEMGDPERARVLMDEMDAIEFPVGPYDRGWEERPEGARSMADPDVPPGVVASAVKVRLVVEVPEGWKRVGDEVDLVCSRSGGVMGVCTALDGNGSMTAWSVGGAPIGVFLPRADETELARVVDVAGPFDALSMVVVTVDPARFPTPAEFLASGATVDAGSVTVFPTYEEFRAAGHGSPPSTGVPSGR